jgi:dTDP-glucose pyrophosphorylase
MLLAGANRICFVISPDKADILHYFGARIGAADLMYVVQSNPRGLCDAVFRPLPFIEPKESVLVGLPDTVWFPEDALAELPDDRLSFLLFPVDRPEFFDAVLVDSEERVLGIESKQSDASSNWVWGAFKLPCHVLAELHELWQQRQMHDLFLGPLVNAYLAAGGEAWAFKTGRSYVDVGTLHGYRAAMRLLSGESPENLVNVGAPEKDADDPTLRASRIPIG